MGFGRPNRSAAGDQAAAQQLRLSKIAEDTAQRDKISLISEQLDEETRLRRKRFGSRMGLGSGNGGNFPIGAMGGAATGGASSAMAGVLPILFRGLQGLR